MLGRGTSAPWLPSGVNSLVCPPLAGLFVNLPVRPAVAFLTSCLRGEDRLDGGAMVVSMWLAGLFVGVIFALFACVFMA